MDKRIGFLSARVTCSGESRSVDGQWLHRRVRLPP
jgi:hypothetical protein